MYIAPNTSVLKKVLLASTAGLMMLVGVILFVGDFEKKPEPIVVPAPVVVVETPPPVIEKKQDKLHLFGANAPFAFTLPVEFTTSEVYTPTSTKVFVRHNDVPLATLSRVVSKKDLEINENVSIADEAVIDVSGIAYVRQQVIEDTEVKIRVIPGSKCKNSDTCALFVATLDRAVTPETLALFETILNNIIWLEQPQGWKQYTLQTSEKTVRYFIAPGATRVETKEKNEIKIMDGEEWIATIQIIPTTEFPYNKKLHTFTDWNIHGGVRTVFDADGGTQITFIPLSKDRGLQVSAWTTESLITLLSLN